MTTLKEKASMLAVRGLANVIEPAMKTVFDWQKRWKGGNDKEFFARLKHVFDYTDMPLPDANVIDLKKMGVIDEEDEMPTSVIEALQSLKGLMEHAQANGLIDKKVQECDCDNDCVMHPVYQRKASRSEEHTSELQSPCNLVC